LPAATPLLADLEPEIAFDALDPFILLVVQVTRGTALFMERVPDDE
jgi:hypothetical protein